jgi:hypothetical protein
MEDDGCESFYENPEQKFGWCLKDMRTTRNTLADFCCHASWCKYKTKEERLLCEEKNEGLLAELAHAHTSDVS